MGFVTRTGKPKTRTFRIDESLDEALVEEAEQKEVSVNNLTESIFEKYLNFNRWYERIDTLALTPDILTAILDQLDQETIKKLGNRLGSTSPKNDLMIRGIPLNTETANLYVEKILGENDQWFDASYIDQEQPYLYIRTQLGEKWITFIEAYLRSFYKECIGEEVQCKRIGDNLQIILE